MAQPERPNIVVITTDQQRFDTVLPWKPPFLRTPHLDHLMAEGVTFSSAYADAPICVAARVGLLTGQYVHHHGVIGNGRTSDALDSRRTLPARLRDLGYQTCAIGKLHFTPIRARHGFDETIIPADYYRDMRNSGNPLQPMRHGLGQNELIPGMATVPEAMTLTNWIAEKSREFMMERRDPTAPFFLWCSFSKPHPPFDPPEPYYSMYRQCPMPARVMGDWCGDDRAPEAMKRYREAFAAHLYTDELLKESWAAYYGMITQIDYNIGRILAALREFGGDQRELDRTLIIFTSDHGEYLGDHCGIAKSFFHEVSAHVPFVMRVPGGFERGLYGVDCPHLTTPADIAATCIRAAGGDVPAEMDGLDLIGLAGGAGTPRRWVTSLTAPSPEGAHAALGITDGRWKYLWFPEGGAEQLFDLANDRRETRNLAGQAAHAAKRDELRNALIALHATLPYGYVKDGRLVTTPIRDDKVNGRRKLHPWAPGNTTEWLQADIQH